jgi:tetratricopeptide (TPR) repeat protein
VKLAPLKGRARAAAKARNEYAKNTAPATSWLFDLVRGSVMCATEEEIVRLYEALDKDPRVDIVRTKNRFNPPCFNGFVFLLSNCARFRPRRRYRDILMNVAVRVEGAAGEIAHLCELQIHHAPIKESEPMHKSHVTYEFFREYFLGNQDAVEQRLNMLCALPVADAENVDDLVDRVLGSDRAADKTLLLELAELLESIAEHASAVHVQEKVLEIDEREFGPDHVEVAGTLHKLGNAYGDLGDNAKKRELYERALAINEREYGRDHPHAAFCRRKLGV